MTSLEISMLVAKCDFQQCGILTNVDSDEPLSLETPNDVRSVA